jgi:SAM-dependent methyltransferase
MRFLRVVNWTASAAVFAVALVYADRHLAPIASYVSYASAGQALPQLPPAPAPERRPDVIYVPTRVEVVTAMLKLAKVTNKDVVYDLGCGDGRIPVMAARDFGARGVGIDIDPQRIAEAEATVKEANVGDRVKIIRGDLFEADIKNASVVTLYLLQTLNQKLRPKLQRDLKPGTRIVSHAFDMGPEWPPEQTEEVGGTRIYLWTIQPKS